jgi:hypothetical protein
MAGGVRRRQQKVDPIPKLRDLAISLAGVGREDSDAVARLREGAGSDYEPSLTRAAESLSIGPGAPIDEFAEWDRAYRLLRAAAADRAVEPVSAERAAFFAQVSALDDGPIDSGWARLVEAQPALIELEADVRRAEQHGPDETWERINLLEELLHERLENLVGPTAEGQDDPLLRTGTAFRLADKYLGKLYGVDPAERYVDAGGVTYKKVHSNSSSTSRRPKE